MWTSIGTKVWESIDRLYVLVMLYVVENYFPPGDERESEQLMRVRHYVIDLQVACYKQKKQRRI
jgi:hypothetical protein